MSAKSMAVIEWLRSSPLVNCKHVLRCAYVGRVTGMPYSQVDQICKLVPNNPANPVSLAEAIEQEPQLKKQIEQDPTVKRLFDIAMQLEGLYRLRFNTCSWRGHWGAAA